MKPLYLLAVISTGIVFLSSCASHVEKPVVPAQKSAKYSSKENTSTCVKKKKNPLRVSFYTKAYPKTPYTVVGEESISKFNQGGIKRQEAHLHDAMRELAAAMGGDAVIDIKSDGKSISGTVVAFQKDVTPTLIDTAPNKNNS
jgi:hypothetical protein